VPGVDDHIAEVQVIDVATADHDGVGSIKACTADPGLAGTVHARLGRGGPVRERITGAVSRDVTEAA